MSRISPIQPNYPADKSFYRNNLSYFVLPSQYQESTMKFNFKPQQLMMRQVPEVLRKLIILHFTKGENDPMKKPINEEVEKAIDSFIETYIESLRDTYNNPLEPFEAYSNRMRAEIYRDANEFKERFTRGFYILMEQLQKKEK